MLGNSQRTWVFKVKVHTYTCQYCYMYLTKSPRDCVIDKKSRMEVARGQARLQLSLSVIIVSLR